MIRERVAIRRPDAGPESSSSRALEKNANFAAELASNNNACPFYFLGLRAEEEGGPEAGIVADWEFWAGS